MLDLPENGKKMKKNCTKSVKKFVQVKEKFISLQRL
jgi:hypothetical protein